MRAATLTTTAIAAALLLGLAPAVAQDFDDDFDDDFEDDFDDDFDDFDDDGDDDLDDAGFDEVDFAEDDDNEADGDAGERGLGVGVAVPVGQLQGLAFLSAPAVPGVSYDMEDFHIDGHLQFSTGEIGPLEQDVTTVGLGGRFLYHLFAHDRSDFSVGGGLSFINVSGDALPESQQHFFFEGLAEIRMFLVPQVALTSSAGITVGFGDADGAALGGRALAGVKYFIE